MRKRKYIALLKESVCKKCRLKELGKEGWSDMATAWFYPYGVRKEGIVLCPHPLLNRIRDKIISKVLEVSNEGEKFLIKEAGAFRSFSSINRYTHEDVPPWCPYKSEHRGD